VHFHRDLTICFPTTFFQDNRAGEIADESSDQTRRAKPSGPPQGEPEAEKQAGVLILASDLSSCIGLNRYRSKSMVVEEMWRKQFPQHFRHVCELLRRRNLPVHVSKEDTGKKPRRKAQHPTPSEDSQVDRHAFVHVTGQDCGATSFFEPHETVWCD
jgi:hypothetical protein